MVINGNIKMTNKELINSQLEKAKPITQEQLQKLSDGRLVNGSDPIVKFTSGRVVKEGDIMLFGFIVSVEEPQEEPKERAKFDSGFEVIGETPIKELKLTLISFPPDEYGSIYVDDEEFAKRMGPSGFSGKDIPYLKVK
jgi:hypothetical protein